MRLIFGTAVLVLAGLVCLEVLRRLFRPNYRKRRHSRKQEQGRRVLEKINGFPLMGQRLSYLRKMDPFAFEELLLEAFERGGYEVRRNRRYSGDGGIDGVVVKDQTRFLVQAKRYRGYINRADVEAFGQVLEARRVRGFFCHTGKTGREAKAEAARGGRMTILSGHKLLEFLAEAERSE